MTATHAIRVFDKIALRLFNITVTLGLAVVALASVVQSIQA
jgi:hypothetical protein